LVGSPSLTIPSPFLRPFPPFIHCFPRIKIKESYWLGSSGREVRGKGTEGRKGRMRGGAPRN